MTQQRDPDLAPLPGLQWPEIPASERRYLRDMPDLQATDHPASYLRAIRAALEACR